MRTGPTSEVGRRLSIKLAGTEADSLSGAADGGESLKGGTLRLSGRGAPFHILSPRTYSKNVNKSSET
jgi:hypothetical protein